MYDALIRIHSHIALLGEKREQDVDKIQSLGRKLNLVLISLNRPPLTLLSS